MHVSLQDPPIGRRRRLPRNRHVACFMRAIMNDTFEARLRAFVQAGWRALLVGLLFITVVWLAYLEVTRARPAWFLALWGGDLDWSTVSTVSLWSVAVIKIGLYAQGMLVL